MKISKQVIAPLIVLAFLSLACGTSNDVVVNTPGASGASSNNDQPQPTSTTQAGTTRSNPAPAGSEVVFDDMSFVVLNTIRPANDIVKTGNEFNTTPEEGQEYVFVEVQVTCKKTTDEKCSFNPTFSTKLLGSKGIEYDPDIFIAGVDKLLNGTEFYGDAVISGYIPFIISKDETGLILIYDPLLSDKFYLAIPE